MITRVVRRPWRRQASRTGHERRRDEAAPAANHPARGCTTLTRRVRAHRNGGAGGTRTHDLTDYESAALTG